MSVSDITAVLSAIIAIVALFLSLYATGISQKHATSDFAATQRVKSDTAQLLATFRSYMIKGVVYTQRDSGERDDSQSPSYVDISSEHEVIDEFLHSPTALAYHSFVATKSREAAEAGRAGEDWRVFFLLLGELRHTSNPYLAAKRAGRLEKFLDNMEEADYQELANSLGDLPKAITNLLADRDHDVIAKVLVGMQNEGPVPKEDFIDFVNFLRDFKEIDDPDLDLFAASTSGDIELLKSALGRGGDPTVRSGAIIQRYEEHVEEFTDRQRGAASP